jgi:hypothetical protein
METHGVSIRVLRVLRGPNLYAYMPVLQVTLDIGPYEDRPSHVWSDAAVVLAHPAGPLRSLGDAAVPHTH